MNDIHLIKPRGRQRQIERGGDILRFHRGAELPGDNETREVVEHGGEIVPAPRRDLEVGEVGLPELVRGRGLVLERESIKRQTIANRRLQHQLQAA